MERFIPNSARAPQPGKKKLEMPWLRNIMKTLSGRLKGLLPQELLKKYELSLYQAGFEVVAVEYLAFSIIATILLTIPVSILKPLYTPIAAGGLLATFVLIIPYMGITKRIAAIEEALPDVLTFLAQSLNAGISLTEALEEAAKYDFGPISKELRRTVRDIRLGRPTSDALRALAVRNKRSDIFYKTMLIIVEAQEKGASMANILTSISNDVRETLKIRKERKAMTGMQVMFFGAASAFLAPLILGIIAKLTIGFSNPAYGINLTPDPIVSALKIFVVELGIISGIAIGVVREGNPTAGLKFSAGMAVAGYFIFTKIVQSGFLTI